MPTIRAVESDPGVFEPPLLINGQPDAHSNLTEKWSRPPEMRKGFRINSLQPTLRCVARGMLVGQTPNLTCLHPV
jgi:hypothetical protein